MSIKQLKEFFIDNSLDRTDAELAKATGLPAKTVEKRRKKSRVKEVDDVGQENPVQQEIVPHPTLNQLISRQNGTTSLTGPAAMAADDIDGNSPESAGKRKTPTIDPFDDETRVFKIKK